MMFCKKWKDISESLRKGDIRRENQLAAADAIDNLIQLHKEDTDEVIRLTKLCREMGNRMTLKYNVGDEINFNINWISIKEELPEELHVDDDRWSFMVRPSDDVLVYLQREKRQTVAWYSWADDTWTTVDECRCYGGTEISHWKRLGSPPVNETELL